MRLSVIESLLLLAWINKIHNMGDIDLFFEAFTYEDKDYNVRTDAFETLKRSYINDERFVDYLLESLKVVTSIKRLEIIETLGESGNPKSVEPIIKLLENIDLELRTSVIQALGEIADKRVL